jgi:hypothetical protein
MEYLDFLKSKMKSRIESGFIFPENKMNEKLFPFQKFILSRALKSGKYAIFADCGLGKTFMQLEFARIVHEYENKKVLILAPLAVVEQTTQEAHKMGISLEGIDITNYEQIDNIDCESYIGIVLDESSILKNFTGSYKKRIIERFARTKYKLACTATPAPNDPEEIGNHSEFLSNMTRTEMLAMYFVHDAGDTGEWRLKGHSIDYFYEWISSWAIMLNNPADIGFEMVGYSLPKLNLIENKIETSWKGVDLFNDTSVNATDFNAELRRTKIDRAAWAG